MLYANEAEFLAATVPFVADGIAAREPVMVALRPAGIAALRSALGPTDDGAIHFVDMTEIGRNPARIIPAWREFVDRGQAAGHPRRGVGEPIWSERSDVELIECQRHEALLNVAFADAAPLWLMCPYDTSSLSSPVIDEARRSHPHLRVDGEGQPSPTALGDEMAIAHLAAPLTPPVPPFDELTFGPPDVRAVRDYVAAHIVATDMDAVRGFDLLVAATEIATNSLRHGGGQGQIRVWHDRETLVCEFTDTGSLTDPMAGRLRPPPDAEGQRGLWLANQLCDIVQIRVFATGTVVRLHMAIGDRRPGNAERVY